MTTNMMTRRNHTNNNYNIQRMILGCYKHLYNNNHHLPYGSSSSSSSSTNHNVLVVVNNNNYNLGVRTTVSSAASLSFNKNPFFSRCIIISNTNNNKNYNNFIVGQQQQQQVCRRSFSRVPSSYFLQQQQQQQKQKQNEQSNNNNNKKQHNNNNNNNKNQNHLFLFWEYRHDLYSLQKLVTKQDQSFHLFEKKNQNHHNTTTTEQSSSSSSLRPPPPIGYLLYLNHYFPNTSTKNDTAMLLFIYYTYYTLRSFYIETGMKRKLPHSQQSNNNNNNINDNDTKLTEQQQQQMKVVQFYEKGIHAIFDSSQQQQQQQQNENSNTNLSTEYYKDIPSLKLVNAIYNPRHHPFLQSEQQQDNNNNNNNMIWSKEYFEKIMEGRKRDIVLKQYQTVQELIDQSTFTFGTMNLLFVQTILQAYVSVNSTKTSSSTTTTETSSTPIITLPSYIHEAIIDMSICYGICYSLQNTIATLSNTGQLYLPKELCQKYHVKSPRYLLSTLGLGDRECQEQLQKVVQELCTVAVYHLKKSREHREKIIHYQLSDDSDDSFLSSVPPVGQWIGTIMALTTLPCENYLLALEKDYNYQLTALKPQSSSSSLLQIIPGLSNTTATSTTPLQQLVSIYSYHSLGGRTKYY